MRIGMLTGGGDAPGLNAVIRAVVRKATDIYGDVVIGFRNGWKGAIDGEADTLTSESVKGILPRGGTILGSSRTNPFKVTDGVKKIEHTLKSLKLDALIAIGGEDTLGVANKLFEQGIAVVGVPKTIDNDLSGTDFTFGFNTAVEIATEALDRLHTTAESHQRVMVVELMGRHAGWISTYAGIAAGADVILIPEHPFDLDEVCEHIQRRHQRGRTFSIVVVAEGATPKEGTWETQDQELDQFGHVRLGGIANALAPEIEKRTGFETRVTILGHVQRGGTPSAFDRVLATRFGIAAIDAVHDKDFGKMVALRGNEIIRVSLQEGVGELKTIDPEVFKVAEVFFG
ncbi:MAG TPA: 6-phosphofructokinase [Actinomycetota bacterium]|nr:6-phosphofructokinase [Actinomycetota bacterium]